MSTIAYFTMFLLISGAPRPLVGQSTNFVIGPELLTLVSRGSGTGSAHGVGAEVQRFSDNRIFAVGAAAYSPRIIRGDVSLLRTVGTERELFHGGGGVAGWYTGESAGLGLFARIGLRVEVFAANARVHVVRLERTYLFFTAGVGVVL